MMNNLPARWTAAALVLAGLCATRATAAPLSYDVRVEWDAGTPLAATFIGSFDSDPATGALTRLNGVLVDVAGTFALPYQFGSTQYGLPGLPDGAGGTYDYAFSDATFDQAVLIDVREPDPTATRLDNTAFYLSYFDVALGTPSAGSSWTSVNASSVRVSAAVPEPSQAWLLLAGIAGMAAALRRVSRPRRGHSQPGGSLR